VGAVHSIKRNVFALCQPLPGYPEQRTFAANSIAIQPAHSPLRRGYLSGSGVPSGGITCATLSVIETAV
jgi:hypothetical protein